jgi:Fic family protein
MDLTLIGGLPEPTVFQDVWAGIWTEETHNSTAIEGNTLRLKQVQLLLEDGVVSGSQKDLSEWYEAKAYGEAARWVYREAYLKSDDTKRITEPEIQEIHRRVVESVWAFFPPEGLVRGEKPGSYRLKDHDPLRQGLSALPCSVVKSELAIWVERANDDSWSDTRGLHIIERLAELHAGFERIHPFPDGNGRAGRLVMSMLLVQARYPPAIIYMHERKRYLKALMRADEGDCGPLTELLARSVRDGIHRFLIPKLAGPLSVVPLAGLADDELSRHALVAAAQRGRLRAHKYAGAWYSTPQWVNEYKSSRFKRPRLPA